MAGGGRGRKSVRNRPSGPEIHHTVIQRMIKMGALTLNIFFMEWGGELTSTGDMEAATLAKVERCTSIRL